jgi:hypothetical protein
MIDIVSSAQGLNMWLIWFGYIFISFACPSDLYLSLRRQEEGGGVSTRGNVSQTQNNMNYM